MTAIKELEKLHTQKLWQCGKSKQYYTGLTEILREYLVGRYHFQAMEMTSAEILACIRELAVEERSAARLKRLLEVADFVKFAKLEPDPEQNEDAYQDAYYFVEETKEQPAEQQSGQNGNGQNGQSGANAMQSTVVPQSPVVSQASGIPQSTSQPITAQRVVSPQEQVRNNLCKPQRFRMRPDLTSQSHHLVLMLTQSSSDRKRSLCHMLQMSTLQPIEVLWKISRQLIGVLRF